MEPETFKVKGTDIYPEYHGKDTLNVIITLEFVS